MSTRITAAVCLSASLVFFGVTASAFVNEQTREVSPAVQQSPAAETGGQAAPPAAQAKPVATPAPSKAAKPDAPPAPSTATEPVLAPQAQRQAASRSSLDQVVNVRFDVTITYAVRGGAAVTRGARLTVADGSSGSLRAGNEVPVPSTTFTPASQPESGATTKMSPMTSYQYKSVGINVDVERVVVDGNRVKANLRVDFTAIDERAGNPPRPSSFPKFLQTFSIVFESGKPMVVARSNDVIDNVESTQMVEVTATILK